jgi:hypothetical protein
VSLIKFVLYSIVAYFVLKVVVRLIGPGRQEQKRAKGRTKFAGRMRRCDACGTFVAESKALILGGRGFCSTACVERVART